VNVGGSYSAAVGRAPLLGTLRGECRGLVQCCSGEGFFTGDFER
jgi:hypothetical protein